MIKWTRKFRSLSQIVLMRKIRASTLQVLGYVPSHPTLILEVRAPHGRLGVLHFSIPKYIELSKTMRDVRLSLASQTEVEACTSRLPLSITEHKMKPSSANLYVIRCIEGTFFIWAAAVHFFWGEIDQVPSWCEQLRMVDSILRD
jgi:hypothetical protein